MFLFVLWLFSVLIGGLLVKRSDFSEFIPAFKMTEPHLSQEITALYWEA